MGQHGRKGSNLLEISAASRTGFKGSRTPQTALTGARAVEGVPKSPVAAYPPLYRGPQETHSRETGEFRARLMPEGARRSTRETRTRPNNKRSELGSRVCSCAERLLKVCLVWFDFARVSRTATDSSSLRLKQHVPLMRSCRHTYCDREVG